MVLSSILAPDGPSVSTAPSTQPPRRLAPGESIAEKFVVKRFLGEGSGGAVYEAVHVAIGNRVAVKVLHAGDGMDAKLLERFGREARICAAVRSAHVPQVYDVGHLEDGSPYIVMEYLDGETLEHFLRRGTIPFPLAIEMTRQLLAALSAVHREGAVHRDVKPQNLVLHGDGSGGRVVKLVDFGISKPIDAPTEPSVTEEGLVLGTPHYMAPEQMRAEPINASADVYSAGVVLYEMITGRPPFDAHSAAHLAASILRDPVLPPRILRPDCPAELEAIALAAIDRDRNKRFRSARSMSRALARVATQLGYPTGAKVWQLAPTSEAQGETRGRDTRRARSVLPPGRTPTGQESTPAPEASRTALHEEPITLHVREEDEAVSKKKRGLFRRGVWLGLMMLSVVIGLGVFLRSQPPLVVRATIIEGIEASEPEVATPVASLTRVVAQPSEPISATPIQTQIQSTSSTQPVAPTKVRARRERAPVAHRSAAETMLLPVEETPTGETGSSTPTEAPTTPTSESPASIIDVPRAPGLGSLEVAPIRVAPSPRTTPDDENGFFRLMQSASGEAPANAETNDAETP